MTKTTDQLADTRAEHIEVSCGHEALTLAGEYAAGWARLTEFLAANPDITSGANTYSYSVLVYLSPGDDVLPRMADYTRRAKAAGARVEKQYGEYGKVLLHFGPIYLQVYASREDVCERVVVGTREVEVEEPDPEALAAVPTVKRTEIVEVVEWQCHPILAGAERAALGQDLPEAGSEHL